MEDVVQPCARQGGRCCQGYGPAGSPNARGGVMAQTKFGSFVESWANIAVGFAINFSANLLILPHFGFTSLNASKAFGIGVIFTGISLARSYCLRRWFNGLRWGQTEAKS